RQEGLDGQEGLDRQERQTGKLARPAYPACPAFPALSMRFAFRNPAFLIFSVFTPRTRATASRRYVSSISEPMKLRPSLAHATAVLPRPVNGSITTSIRLSPCSRRHCSGSRDGKVAGCGRSRSRRWIVSYGMNHVLPRQRTPSAAARHRPTFD